MPAVKRKRGGASVRGRKNVQVASDRAQNVPAASSRPTRKRRRLSSEDVDGQNDENLDPIDDYIEVAPLTTSQPLEDALDDEIMQEDSLPGEPDAASTPAEQQMVPGHDIFKSLAIERLTGRRLIPFRGCEGERQKIFNLIEQTVSAGEGNSLLVIGPRGSGKSRAVNDALQRMSVEHPGTFHVVKLNGLIHTDDKLALREIWRQLGKELDPTEDDEHSKNYADTLARLLAVLSHPTELSDGNIGMVADAVIFVLDEFDLFATHARQTLLYNLLDVAQSRKAPIAVLGLTAKVNAVEMLEKRVKSRFSHRYVYLKPHDSLAAFRDSCAAALSLAREDLSTDMTEALSRELNYSEGKGIPVAPKKKTTRKSKVSAKAPSPAKPSAQDEKFLGAMVDAWNAYIRHVVSRNDVLSAITHIYYTSNSFPLALSTLHTYLDNGPPSGPAVTISTLPPDSKLSLLPQLPTLALTLLICAARLDVILAADVCNFAMAYDEYASLISRGRVTSSGNSNMSSAWGAGDGGLGGRLWSRAAGREAWSALLALELLVPATGAVGRRALAETEMVRCDVALEEIVGSVPELERGLVKWCKEI